MLALKDYYLILQVAPTAEPEVIEVAIPGPGRKYHPDVNHTSEAVSHMPAVNEAYEVLPDPITRTQYDLARAEYEAWAPAEATRTWYAEPYTGYGQTVFQARRQPNPSTPGLSSSTGTTEGMTVGTLVKLRAIRGGSLVRDQGDSGHPRWRCGGSDQHRVPADHRRVALPDLALRGQDQRHLSRCPAAQADLTEEEGTLMRHATRTLTVIAVFLCLVWVSPLYAQQTGILIEPIETTVPITLGTIETKAKVKLGEPGQFVRFFMKDTDGLNIDIQLHGQIVRNVSRHHVLPLDSTFVPARVYQYVTERRDPQWGSALPGMERADNALEMFKLSHNVANLFPNHPLAEELLFLAYQCADKAVSFTYGPEIDFTNVLATIDAYLQRYPQGIHRDEIEWRRAQLKHYVYEFEGYVPGMLEQARAFETFLDQHPTSTMTPQVLLRIADLYRMAAESVLTGASQESGGHFTVAEAQQFARNATEIYQRLITSLDPAAQAAAQVALYNLRQGRRAYYQLNGW